MTSYDQLMRVSPYYVAISRLPLAGKREESENLTHCSISQVLLSFKIVESRRARDIKDYRDYSPRITGDLGDA
jgi:hypothetical protein